MSDPAQAPDALDSAAIGYAILSSGMEEAFAAAQAEILALGRVVQAGFGTLHAPAPQALPPERSAGAPEPATPLPTSAVAPNTAKQAPPRSEAPRGRTHHTSQPTASIRPHAPPQAPQTAPVARPLPAPTAMAPLPAAEAADTDGPTAPMASPAQVVPAATAPTQFATVPVAGSPQAPVDSLVATTAAIAPPAASPPILFGTVASPVSSPLQAVEESYAPPISPLAPLDQPTQPMAPVRDTGRRHDREPSVHHRHDTASAQNVPMQGDVFLDGMRVGRWVSETLARAAGGPAGGSTAFDPRLSPRWPGTLQGQ